MGKIGLTDKQVAIYGTLINIGRKNLTVQGKTEKGLRALNKGISKTMKVFDSVVGNSPKSILQIELLILNEDLNYCDKDHKQLKTSLEKAIFTIKEALCSCSVVTNPDKYRFANATHSHLSSNLYQGVPKDVFHLACNSHKTRLQNYQHTPGMGEVERNFYARRMRNLSVAKSLYVKLQQEALI